MKPSALIGVGVAALGTGLVLALSMRKRPPIEPPQPSPGGSARLPIAWTDVEALARVIVSEAGDGTLEEQRAVAWAARNRARWSGLSVRDRYCKPNCGPVWEGNSRIRPMSSHQTPKPAHVRLAAEILALPQTTDPTSGANSIIEPALQDELAAKQLHDHKFTYAQVRAKWLAAGHIPIQRVGRFEFWRIPDRKGA